MARATRWRAVGVQWRGYRIARIEERATGRVIGVYHRLGRWRYYASDKTVTDSALASCARRALTKEAT